MNQIQRAIKDSVLDQTMVQVASTTTGYVIRVMGNKATVDVYEERIGRYITYDSVPIDSSSAGVIATSIKPRQQVWVEFIGGNKVNPRITGIYEEEYNREREGSNNGSSIPTDNGILENLNNSITPKQVMVEKRLARLDARL